MEKIEQFSLLGKVWRNEIGGRKPSTIDDNFGQRGTWKNPTVALNWDRRETKDLQGS